MEISPHRLSREQAKEGPRLLESLAGAETVVFRVQGAVSRVELFREVVGGGSLKLATCPLLSNPLVSSQPMESHFQVSAERIGNGIGGPRHRFPWLVVQGLSVLRFLILTIAQGLKPEPGAPAPAFLHIHTWGTQGEVGKKEKPIGE